MPPVSSSPAGPVRVLLAEPSAYMCRRLAEAINATGDLRVIATAADGEHTLLRATDCDPDVIALPVSLPRVDGLVVIERIMRRHPRPIVVLDERADASSPGGRAALAAGAIELVSRPAGVLLDPAELCTALIAALRRAARVRVVRTTGAPLPGPATRPQPVWVPPVALTSSPAAHPVVVIASSTGGPAALLHLATRWSARPLPAILVAQHLPRGFTAELARQWQALCPFAEVREALPGDRPQPGLILIAPGGLNLEVDPRGTLSPVAPGDTPWVPSANLLLATASAAYRTRVLAIILTGMGDDGAEGVRAVVAGGGLAWAQDSASCVVDGMPASARATGLAHSRTLDEIATLVAELAPLRAPKEAVA